MGKGSSPAGQTQTVNPTAAAQLPFLQDIWGKAQNLYNANPTPSPYLTGAYSDIYNTGTSVNQTLRPQTNDAFGNAITGGFGLQNSPATPYFNQFATGTSAPQQALAGYGAQAAAGGGPGLDQLAASARGDYLNSNPYIAAAVKAAQDPVTRAYQTATAPQTDANFAGAGRYGSGALLGARSQNEQNLGKALGDISTNLYSADYGRERQLQDQAASSYGQLRNAGLGLGIGAATQGLAGQEAGATGLQGGYQAGNAATLQALGYAPQIQQLQYQPAQMQVNAATGMQNAPYDLLGKYSTLAGQAVGPSGSTNQPYFQNDTANALSALSGVAGLGNTLAGGGGLGGLLGGGAGGIGAFGPELSGAAAESLLAAPGAAFLDASGGTALATLASAAPAAAAWIVCTELKRQGRMPAKHWAVGVKVFDTYPEIGKRGYYVWAIPSVRHLRRRPDSLYSRLLGTIFRWRAENIAASVCVKGARRLWRGRLVTVALVPVCLILGALCGPQDWSAVYREEAAR